MDVYDVKFIYGEEAADVYSKLCELTDTSWVDSPLCYPYWDSDKMLYCCSSCDNPVIEFADYCPYCCAEIVHSGIIG